MKWNRFSKIKPNEEDIILVWSFDNEEYYVGLYGYALDSEPYLKVSYQKDGCTCQYHSWEYGIDMKKDSWLLLPRAHKE